MFNCLVVDKIDLSNFVKFTKSANKILTNPDPRIQFFGPSNRIIRISGLDLIGEEALQ